MEGFLLSNEVFFDRTSKIGILPADLALSNDVTGPNLRASGVEFDVRKASPHEAYGELDFNVVNAKEGDAYSKTLRRMREIWESLNIIEEALENA